MVDYDEDNGSYMYVYVYEYLSGNLYKKLTRLRKNKDSLIELFNSVEQSQFKFTQEQFIKQENELKKNLPIQAKITKSLDTSLFILPNSKFGNSFRVLPEEVMDITLSSSFSFINAFKEWTKDELDLTLIKKSRTLAEVHSYFTDSKSIKKGENARDYADRRKKAFTDGKVILLEFMNKGLTTNAQLRLLGRSAGGNTLDRPRGGA